MAASFPMSPEITQLCPHLRRQSKKTSLKNKPKKNILTYKKCFNLFWKVLQFNTDKPKFMITLHKSQKKRKTDNLPLFKSQFFIMVIGEYEKTHFKRTHTWVRPRETLSKIEHPNRKKMEMINRDFELCKL